MSSSDLIAVASWVPDFSLPVFDSAFIAESLQRIREPLHVVREGEGGRVGLGFGGVVHRGGYPLLGTLPALYPEWLGDRSFCEIHGTRFPYLSGAMANGIATTRLVIDMAKTGCMGFFGAAGLPLPRIEAALDELQTTLGYEYPWGNELYSFAKRAGSRDRGWRISTSGAGFVEWRRRCSWR